MSDQEKTTTLNELLLMEEDTELWEFCISEFNIPMWLYVRHYVFQAILSRKSDWTSNPIRKNPFYDLYAVKRLFKYMFELLKDISNQITRHEIVLFCNGYHAGNKKDGKWFDPFLDPFADIFPEKTLVIRGGGAAFEFKRPEYYADVKLYGLSAIKEELLNRILKVSAKQKNEIQNFLNVLRDKTDGFLKESHYMEIERLLLHKAKTIHISIKYWEKLIKKTEMKGLMIASGSYGYPHIFAVAQKYNVITFEFQHGLLSRDNYIYIYSDLTKEKMMKENFFPQHFLVWGKYYDSVINTPSKVHVIGAPNGEYMRVKGAGVEEKQEIIFCSNLTIYNDILFFLEKLFEESSIPSVYSIKIRPHPGDSIEIQEKIRSFAHENSIIYSDPNEEPIHHAICEAAIIVSPNSTVLYDAILFNKKILVFENKFLDEDFPEQIFERFSTVEEFVELVNGNNARSARDVDEFWDMNWRGNYKKFIEQYVLKEQIE